MSARVVVLVLVVVMSPAAPARALEVMGLEAVAVMPMGTFRAGDDTVDSTAIVEAALAARGFGIVSRDALEDYLVSQRIRRAEFLDRSAIRTMGTSLRADAMLTGYVEVLDREDSLQVSVNVQLVDCVDGSVVWANAVSLAGRDFVTVLGLGRVDSSVELLERAVDALLEGVPRQAVVDRAAMSPYELVRASFTPDVLRGGEESVLSVEVREAEGGPGAVQAFVLDQEVVLASEDGRWFTGTVRAPSLDGRYGLRLFLRDGSTVHALEDVAVLRVHNTPPEVVMTVRNRAFSPNDDGTLDMAFMTPSAVRAQTLRSWRLDILGPEGAVVRSEAGSGALPDAFVWQGLDGRGMAVADGIYSCRLEVVDQAGNVSTTPSQRLVVDRTPPEVEILLSGPETGRVLETSVSDVSGLESWSLTVFAADGSRTRHLAGQGRMPESLPCGLGGDDAYAAWALEAMDRAGNRLRTERRGLKRKAPPEEAPKKPVEVWVDDF